MKTIVDLVLEAEEITDECLQKAIIDIDRSLGKGYAAKHPELIAAFMQTCTKNLELAFLNIHRFDTTTSEIIRDGLGEIAQAINERGE